MEVESNMSLLKRRAIMGAQLLLVLAMSTFGTASHATSVKQLNVVDLLTHADTIVAGKVASVSDGFGADGLPYTEVTLEVADTIRGKKSATYTFRQFGLDKPRVMPDGRVYLGRPTGFPTWQENETAIVFLYGKARHSGLQTTVGLGYGKVSYANGLAMNSYENAGMFKGVKAGRGVLDSNEQKMFGTRSGPVSASVFQRFLHRAVAGNWVKNGGLVNASR